MEPSGNLPPGLDLVSAVLDSSGDATSILDAEFRILFQNGAHRNLFGDQRGKRCFEALHGRGSVCEDCQSAMVLKDGKPHRTIRTRPLKNGPRYIDLMAYPLRIKNPAGEEIMVVIEGARDITGRMAAEKQRDESRKMLENIANGISESILFITKDRKILWANNAARKDAGHDINGEFCYKATHRLESPCDDHGEVCPLRDLLVYETPRFVEHAHYDRRGNKTVFEVGAYPVRNDAGEVDRFVHVSRDITERKKVEEALKQYREHLEEQVKKRTAQHAGNESRIRTALAEKEALLKELHHRTKNNMSILSGLLHLQSMSIGDERLRQAFLETENRIQAMSLVHERFYKSKDFANLDAKEYMEDFTRALMKGFSQEDGSKVSLKLDIESVPLPADLAIPCGMTINELLTNSLKYAFPGERRGRITIAFHEDIRGAISLVFSDDGVGLPEGLDIDKAKSLGLKLVNSIVRSQLKGRIEVRRGTGGGGGTEFHIRFPREGQ